MCEVPEAFGDPFIATQERELYAPLESYINHGVHLLQRPAHGSLRLVTAETAQTAAPAGGTWTQPDLAAVGISRSKFATTAEIRLFSFEVKTYAGCDLKAVHEALAHTRFVNFSYLVWNRPRCICQDREHYQVIESNCAAYGVGLLTVHNPLNLGTYEVRLPAQRKLISADDMDEFISTRFNMHRQALIIDALQLFCPGPL